MHYLLFALCLLPFSLCAGDAAERLSSLYIYPNSPEMAQQGYYNCDMETNGEANLLQLLRSGDSLFDIGANIGEWSQRALQTGIPLKIHAFEPIPPIFDKLCETLAGNEVSCHQLAIADSAGKREMVYYSALPVLSTLHRRYKVEKHVKLNPILIEVDTERLDSFCASANIPHIDFLKIDTEGAEWEVLVGADKLLNRGAISFIQFEYGGCYLDAKTTLKQVYDYLTARNYAIYRVVPTGIVEISSWDKALENFTYSNYLAVYRETTPR